MNKLIFKSNDEYQIELAQRIKKIRKIEKISRASLSIMSGVPVASIRRFEDTGNISLYSLISIVIALGYENDIENFCIKMPYKNIEDIE